MPQYEGKKLPIDNFSLKLDNRIRVLTEGRLQHWRDSIPKRDTEEPIEQPQNPIEALYQSVQAYSPVNDTDKQMILAKLESITKQKVVNLSEEDFKVLFNIKDEWSEEELAQFCKENFSIVNSYSPYYEFEPETDFLIGSIQEKETS